MTLCFHWVGVFLWVAIDSNMLKKLHKMERRNQGEKCMQLSPWILTLCDLDMNYVSQYCWCKSISCGSPILTSPL